MSDAPHRRVFRTDPEPSTPLRDKPLKDRGANGSDAGSVDGHTSSSNGTQALPQQTQPAHKQAARPYTPPARSAPSASASAPARPPRTPQPPDNYTHVPVIAGVPIGDIQVKTPEEAVLSFRARRRSFLWAGLILLVLLLLIETLILAPWSDPTTGVAPHQISSIPLADVNPFGVNVFLHKEVDTWKKSKTLDMTVDMGAHWIKQQFPWAEIEFAKGNYYDAKNNQSAWAKFDDIVDLADQRGLRIIARLDSTPEWARTDSSMSEAVRAALLSNAKVPPAAGHLPDFADFVRTFVARYRGRISAIQIWNEPNLHDEWPTGVDAKSYVDLLSTGYLAAKSADPNIIVLAAPLATNNETLSFNGNLNELDYLQAMYYAGGKQYFDVMSANAYGKEFPPEDPPSRDRLNFRRVELLRKVMERNGDSNKAIWFNEYGWNASPDNLPTPDDPNQVTYPWGRVTPEQQASYTVQGIDYARENWPWAGVFTIWYLRQVGDIPQTKSEYYFSLLNPEFVPLPAYKSVTQAATGDAQVASPGQWGPLSLSVHAGARWDIHLNPDIPGEAYVVPSASTMQDSDSLSFAFRGTDLSVSIVPPVAASGDVTGTTTLTSTATTASGARYYVMVDGKYSDIDRNLPRDAQGRAYIPMPIGAAQPVDVTLVRGLGAESSTGTHTMTISVLPVDTEGQKPGGQVASPIAQSEPSNMPGIGTITVAANRSYVLFTVLTVLFLVGIAFDAWALWRSGQSTQVGGAGGR